MIRYVLVVAVVACGLSLLPESQATLKQLGKANNQFAIDLYKQLAKERGAEKTIFFSPHSIYIAMALTYLGARGNTQKQLGEKMYFNTLAANEFHGTFLKLAKMLYRDNDNYTLNSANNMFLRKDYKLLDAFLTKCKEYYKVTPDQVDFENDSESARKKINDWVEMKTMDKIQNLLPRGSVDQDTILVLINALYFKGRWSKPFNDTQSKEEDFTINSNRSAPVRMMYQKQEYNYGYSRDLAAQWFEMDYLGKELSTVFMLPNAKEDDALSKLEGKLTADLLDTTLSSGRKQVVEVKVPAFKIWDKFSLTETLKKLGVTDIFKRGADFSGIDGTDRLYVSEVRHKTYLEVNEQGAEGAAATSVVVQTRGRTPRITLNRPFLFLVREKKSGNIIFLGRYVEPPKAEEEIPNGGPRMVLSNLLMILSTLLAVWKM